MKEVNTFWNKSDMLHIDAEWISNISLMIFISPYDSYGRQTVPDPGGFCLHYYFMWIKTLKIYYIFYKKIEIQHFSNISFGTEIYKYNFWPPKKSKH